MKKGYSKANRSSKVDISDASLDLSNNMIDALDPEDVAIDLDPNAGDDRDKLEEVFHKYRGKFTKESVRTMRKENQEGEEAMGAFAALPRDSDTKSTNELPAETPG